jgi:hypothetical protein
VLLRLQQPQYVFHFILLISSLKFSHNAQVERAFKEYETGIRKESGHFSVDNYGAAAEQYMATVTQLSEEQWQGIFAACNLKIQSVSQPVNAVSQPGESSTSLSVNRHNLLDWYVVYIKHYFTNVIGCSLCLNNAEESPKSPLSALYLAVAIAFSLLQSTSYLFARY